MGDKIKLINGDCLELMKNIPDGSVDLVLTDPPYGTTDCKWDSVIPFEPMWEQLNRIIKPNGAICLFGSEPFSSALRMSNIKNFKYDWIWEKPQGGDKMTQKDLFKYQDTKKLYTEAKERLAEFELTIYSPPSPTLDGMPINHDDSNPEHLTETVARHDELISLCNARLVDYIRAGRILDQAETVLTPIEVTIVEKRYRLGMKWNDVAEVVGYSWRITMNKHHEILKKIANL